MAGNSIEDQDAIAAQWEASLDSEDPAEAAAAAAANELSGTMALQWAAMVEDGSRDYAHPIAPSEDRLPLDPSTDVPDGYRADQCDRPGGFSGADAIDGASSPLNGSSASSNCGSCSSR